MTYLHLYTFYIYHVCIKQFEQADMAFTSYVFLRGCIEMRVGSLAGGVQDTLWMGYLIRVFETNPNNSLVDLSS